MKCLSWSSSHWDRMSFSSFSARGSSFSSCLRSFNCFCSCPPLLLNLLGSFDCLYRQNVCTEITSCWRGEESNFLHLVPVAVAITCLFSLTTQKFPCCPGRTLSYGPPHSREHSADLHWSHLQMYSTQCYIEHTCNYMFMHMPLQYQSPSVIWLQTCTVSPLKAALNSCRWCGPYMHLSHIVCSSFRVTSQNLCMCCFFSSFRRLTSSHSYSDGDTCTCMCMSREIVVHMHA